MMRMFALSIVLAGWATAYSAGPNADYPYTPTPFSSVQVDGGFWGPRMATNQQVTVRYCFDKCEETGRIDNFAIAGGLKEGGFTGIYFNDSDVFKVIEGAAYSLQLKKDKEQDRYLDDLIAKIAAAQEDDGYLYTARTIGDPNYNYPGKKGRWTHLGHGHELYNVGHMYEAAVAHYQATGKRSLLDVAIKNADLICKTFGPNEGQRIDVPGHEEIEIGLVKLYRLTGDEKYLRQAKFFIDMRGRKNLRDKFNQDSLQRSLWFGCSYCPVNVVRFLPSIAGMVYAHRDDAAYVNLFMQSTGKIQLPDRIVTSASHSHPADSINAMNDQQELRNSGDHSIPRHTWWDHKGSCEWVQYDFDKPHKVSSVDV